MTKRIVTPKADGQRVRPLTKREQGGGAGKIMCREGTSSSCRASGPYLADVELLATYVQRAPLGCLWNFPRFSAFCFRPRVRFPAPAWCSSSGRSGVTIAANRDQLGPRGAEGTNRSRPTGQYRTRGACKCRDLPRKPLVRSRGCPDLSPFLKF